MGDFSRVVGGNIRSCFKLHVVITYWTLMAMLAVLN